MLIEAMNLVLSTQSAVGLGKMGYGVTVPIRCEVIGEIVELIQDAA